MSPPVLLLHGLATSAHRTWGETGWLDLLADAGRSTIAPNLPGHGGTPGLEDWSTLEDHVESFLPDSPVDAVGFSLGARILLVLASRSPERFGRLVVAGVGANLFRDRADSSGVDSSGADLAQQLAETGDDRTPLVHHFDQLAASSGTDPEAVRALLGRRHTPLIDADLAVLGPKVLVVLGTADFTGPADPLMERLPGARLVELRGVDHFATPKAMGFLDAGLRHLGVD